MFNLIVALITGGLIGRSCQNKPKLTALWPKLITIGLFLLIFAMGLQLGSDPEVKNVIFDLGFKGAGFALTTSLGSLLFSWPLAILWRKRTKEES